MTLGYIAEWGVRAFFMFLVPVTLIFHHNFADKMQMILFLKNLTIIGRLLQVSVHSAGALNLDSYKKQ